MRAPGGFPRRARFAAATSLLTAFAVLSASPAAAQGRDLNPGVVGSDERRIAPEDSRLDAVGRLNLAGSGFCTATLIAPDRALTAAHCLFHPRTGRPLRPESVHFLPGYRKGAWAAHRIAAEWTVAEGFTPPRPTTVEGFAADVAVLRLAAPITDVAPLPTLARAPKAGVSLLSVSYARDRPELPNLERGCRVLSRRGALIAIDCDLQFGGSGGPVLVETPEGLAVAGVAVGVLRSAAGPVRVAAWPPEALRAQAVETVRRGAEGAQTAR